MEEIINVCQFIILVIYCYGLVRFRSLQKDLDEKAGTLSDYEFCREVARKLNQNRDIIHVLVYKDELNKFRINLLYDMGFSVKEDKSNVYMAALMIIEHI